MKKSLQFCLIINLLIVFQSVVYSQIFLPAEYIDYQDVLTTGEININTLKKKESIKFQLENKTIVLLNPTNTKEIIIKNFGRFVAGVVKNKFVEVLVEGEASMYNTGDLLIVNKKGETYELDKKSTRWKGILNIIVSDCTQEKLYNEKELKFNIEKLTDILTKYNECKGKLTSSSNKNVSPNLYYIGPQVGTILTIMHFPKQYDLPRNKYRFGTPTSFTPIFGVKFNTYANGKNQKSNFELSPFVTFEKYYSEILYSDANHSHFIKSRINATSLFVPVIWNYKYLDKNERKMFFNIGIGTKMNLNTYYAADFEETHLTAGTKRYYTTDRLNELKALQLFLVLGHNIGINIHNKNTINIGINGFLMTSHTWVAVKNFITSIQLNAAYEFGL